MKLVVLGCGRVGATIATTMSKEGHEVTIIDQNPDSFRRLGRDYAGKTVVEFMDPNAVLQLVDRPEVNEIAAEVRARLVRVMDAL